MKATMQTAANNLCRQVAKMGDGWAWVKCEIGYVVHQGRIPYEPDKPGWGIDGFRNPILIGTTAALASAWVAPT